MMIGDGVRHQPIILCFPQGRVEVSKIMVKVNALLVPAALGPAYQLRALHGERLVQAKRAPVQKGQGGPQPSQPTRRKAVS